jgi:hypothetical protein
MAFTKGVRVSPATEFKPGQSGNPHGRPSKNVWLRTGAHRTPPPKACPEARRRTFNPRWFALHLGSCARCRAVVNSLALISKR